MKKIVYTLIIVGLVAGLAFVANNEKTESFIASFGAECDTYRTHHKPTEGWYYSVEAVSPTEGGKSFIIGRNMQPKMSTAKDGVVSISLEPNDRLREVEVPSKTAGLKSVGAFFTVKTVDNVPTLIYFPSEREVITHMLRAQDTPAQPPVALAVKSK